MSEKKRKMRDPYAEYRAAKEAIKIITEQITALQEYGADEPKVIDKIAQYAMAMVDMESLKDEAVKQYNAHLQSTKWFLEEAEAACDADNVIGALRAIVGALGNVFQQELLEEDKHEVFKTEEN